MIKLGCKVHRIKISPEFEFGGYNKLPGSVSWSCKPVLHVTDCATILACRRHRSKAKRCITAASRSVTKQHGRRLQYAGSGEAAKRK